MLHLDLDVQDIAERIQVIINSISKERYQDGFNDAILELLSNSLIKSNTEIHDFIKTYLSK